MNFKPVDECYEEGLHILLMKDGTVKWSNRENAHFAVPNEGGVAYNDDAIAYAALVDVESAPEVVYDSIWKYAPNKFYRYAILEKNATLRYFQKQPQRMPDGSYLTDGRFEKSLISNTCYYIKNADLDLGPDYEPGTLVKR